MKAVLKLEAILEIYHKIENEWKGEPRKRV